ncbi:MAG TPA: TOBE domain-containing protein [bacterium]|nr:TOBE domain-containing protein [bacterium]
MVAIETEASLSLVTMQSANAPLTAVIIETPETASYLKPGVQVYAAFKETEVNLLPQDCRHGSMSNQWTGTIVQIRWGKLLTEVGVQTAIGTIRSVLTTENAKRMSLEENHNLEVYVNAQAVAVWEDA